VAYKRSAAVKVATEHPEVIDWLADGTMTLSGLAVLAPHAGDGPLVAQARGKSKRQIQTLAASEHPDRNWNRVQFRVRPVDQDLSTRGQSPEVSPEPNDPLVRKLWSCGDKRRAWFCDLLSSPNKRGITHARRRHSTLATA
jgi:hypothetical protein